MRHLESLGVPEKDVFAVKEEDLSNLKDAMDLKTELPDILEDCDQFIKNEFANENSNFMGYCRDFEFDLNTSGSEFGDFCESTKKTEARKNKRKALTPQRAVQSESSQGTSTSNCTNSSESLPEVSDHFTIIRNVKDGISTSTILDDELFNSDNEDLLKDLGEENIFKDLCEETGEFRISVMVVS